MIDDFQTQITALLADGYYIWEITPTGFVKPSHVIRDSIHNPIAYGYSGEDAWRQAIRALSGDPDVVHYSATRNAVTTESEDTP